MEIENWINKDTFTPEEQIKIRETENKFLIKKEELNKKEYERLLTNLNALNLIDYSVSIWNSATQIIDYLLKQKLQLKEINAIGNNLHLERLIKVNYAYDLNNPYYYITLLERERFHVLNKEELRQIKLSKLMNNNILILDATGAMGLEHIDYSIFDYVIYSTHCICPYYHCAFLFSLENEEILTFDKNRIIKDYNDIVELFLSRKDKIFSLKNILTDLFKDNNKFETVYNNVEYIFSIKYLGDKEQFIRDNLINLKNSGIQVVFREGIIFFIRAYENLLNNNLLNGINFLLEL